MCCSISRHLSRGADSEASNAVRCVCLAKASRLGVRCCWCSPTNPSYAATPSHLHGDAADLDWCGAGGAAHHARLMSRVWLLPYIERYIYVRREVEHVESGPSHLIISRTADLLIVKIQHHFSLFFIIAMSFRCTTCSDKSYDKAWKLQRHIRESSKCFEQLHPGTSATRFRCSICDYTSPREEDLRRHHRRAHPDIAITTATDAEEAEQATLRSTEITSVDACLQPVTLLGTNEHPTQMELINPHQDLKSSAIRPRYARAMIACQNCGGITFPIWVGDKQGNVICSYCGNALYQWWRQLYREDKPSAKLT
jgi:hypothetical protein